MSRDKTLNFENIGYKKGTVAKGEDFMLTSVSQHLIWSPFTRKEDQEQPIFSTASEKGERRI